MKATRMSPNATYARYLEVVKTSLENPHMSQSELSKKLDITKSTIGRALRWWDSEAAEPYKDSLTVPNPIPEKQEVEEKPVDPVELFGQRRKIRRLDAQVKFLRKELEAAAIEHNSFELLNQLAEETAPQLPEAPKVWKDMPTTKHHSIIETPTQMLSDWHAFEEVKASRTRGFAEYNPEIMVRRLGNLVAAHASIVQRMRAGGYVYPECFVPLLGDFVPGTIHELDKHTFGQTVVLTAYNTAWLLAQVLREISRLYERVYVAGVVGNHGRFPENRRGTPTKEPTKNWDYVVYLFAKHMLGDIPGIVWELPDAYSMQVNVRGWNVLMNHGDKIRKWMGIPWYGIERWDVKSTALEAQRHNIIHYRLLGQFHKSAQLPSQVGEKFVNGSVVGANEYAVDLVTESDPPKQLLFFMHEEHGATGRWPLNLTHDRASIPEFTWTKHLEVQQVEDKMGEAPIWYVPEPK